MKQLADRQHSTKTQVQASRKGVALESPMPIQAKLIIGQVHDQYEREADAMADKASNFLSTPSTSESPSIQNKGLNSHGISQINRKEQVGLSNPSASNLNNSTQTEVLQSTLQHPNQGSPLPDSTRAEMEAVFGTEFGGVRVHTDRKAANMSQDLQARAFTHGADVYFNRGEYQPDTSEGKRLLAHELTHVIQQRSGSSKKIQRYPINSMGLREAREMQIVGRELFEESMKKDGQESLLELRDSTTQTGNEKVIQNDLTVNQAGKSIGKSISAEASKKIKEENEKETSLEEEIEHPAKVKTDANDEETGAAGKRPQKKKSAKRRAKKRTKKKAKKRKGKSKSDTKDSDKSPRRGSRIKPKAKSDTGKDSDEKKEEDKEKETEAIQGDANLINFELAEHERWAGSFGEMGTAGSEERAKFLLNQTGKGAVAGAKGSAAIGFAMGAVGAAIGKIAAKRLATFAVSKGAKVIPVPGLGEVIGGIMAIAGLAMRDWGATKDTINRIGTGKGYERMANDLEGVAEAVDVATQIMDVLAGVMGAISVGMWVASVASAGVLSPLAITLSSIAFGIGLATTAVGILISAVVRPSVTALRALHAFESQGDPAQIERDGQMLQSAASQVTGAVVGAAAGRAGGKVGGYGGSKINAGINRIQALRKGGTPPMSAVAGKGPRINIETPKAPKKASTQGKTQATSTKPTGPKSSEGPAARSPLDSDANTSANRPESFADLADVVADLNASPEVKAMLTDNRAPIQRRSKPWTKKEARKYANKQAKRHREATGMTGSETQAGHTAAARHAKEAGTPEKVWDRQSMMDLPSRKGKGLDVEVSWTDSKGKKHQKSRTRHTSQEMLINDAVQRVRDAQGELGPQGHIDAADYVKYATENLPYDQANIDMLRASGRAKPDAGPPVDPATGIVITSPSASSPLARGAHGSGKPRSSIPSHTQTAKTSKRAKAVAQYHDQISADPGRESGIWKDANGDYHVMQGDGGSVAPPSGAKGPLELIYHSHPTQTGANRQGTMSQPSQAGGDLSVIQFQHGQGTPGKKQSSVLHFPTYDKSGKSTGYGTTKFEYEPTHPLPIKVETTLPGGKKSTQRYSSYADFEKRTGIPASAQTKAEAVTLRQKADAQLKQDASAAQKRVNKLAADTSSNPTGLTGMRVGRDLGRQKAAEEMNSDRPVYGPAYTANLEGIEGGKTSEIAINPPYPPPPGTMAEIHALMKQVKIAQATQEVLGGTQSQMRAKAKVQRAHSKGLGKAQNVSKGLQDGRSAHQKGVDNTSKTNVKQKAKSASTLGTLGKAAKHQASVKTLMSSLSVFQGMTHLFGYLPGALGAKAHKAKKDSTRLINTLNKVNGTGTVKKKVATGKKVLDNNTLKISTVSSKGKETDKEMDKGHKKLVKLDQANTAELNKTEAVKDLATKERWAAKASEKKAQAAHDSLYAKLQAWAIVHQQVREKTINDTIAAYEARGFKARRVP